MLRRTEGSSKEEQIIQKEQILAELQVMSGAKLGNAQCTRLVSCHLGYRLVTW